MCNYRRISLVLAVVLGFAVGSLPGIARAQADDEDDRGAASPSLRLALKDLLEQPPPAVDPTSPVPTSPRAAPSRRSTYARLARAPNMFGDAQLVYRTLSPNGSTGNEFPTVANFGSNAAGSRKIAENDKSLPMDRFFFGYNYYTNVQQPLGYAGFNPPQSTNMSRYTFGFEKTFFDGWWSAEARIAAGSSTDAALDQTRYDGGVPSTVTLYLKNLLYNDDWLAFGSGLGVSLPTSSDVIVSSPDQVLRYREQATRLLPYIGFLAMPDDDWFVNGFLQLDFSSGNDRLDQLAPGGGERPIASLPQQHLLFADLSVGRWVYRDEQAPVLSGIAAMVELHYFTTLNDSAVSQVTIPYPPYGMSTFTLSNFANRVDVLNLTGGLQFQLGSRSNLRVAGVVPLSQDLNRLFDGELQVFFNRMF